MNLFEKYKAMFRVHRDQSVPLTASSIEKRVVQSNIPANIERSIVENDISFSIVKPSWSPETQPLIDWFIKLEPPAEPFYLEPHIRVRNPAKFFATLQREIETGPSGPRARMGTLQSDLRKLKAYINKSLSS